MISLTMSSFFAERGVVVGVGWLLRSMNATQRFFIQQQAVSATRRIYSADNAVYTMIHDIVRRTCAPHMYAAHVR